MEPIRVIAEKQHTSNTYVQLNPPVSSIAPNFPPIRRASRLHDSSPSTQKHSILKYAVTRRLNPVRIDRAATRSGMIASRSRDTRISTRNVSGLAVPVAYTCNVLMHNAIMLLVNTVVLVVMVQRRGQTDSGAGHLSILHGSRMPGTAPPPKEPGSSASRARCVTVSWAGAESSVLTVLPSEPQLHQRADDEEERANDGHGENNALHATHGLQARGDVSAREAGMAVWCAFTERSADRLASAGCGAIASLDGDVDEASGKSNVQDDADKGKEYGTAKAAGEKYCRDGVTDCNAGDALNGAVLGGNMDVVGVLNSQEVRVKGQNHSRATEAQDVEKRLKALEKYRSERHLDR